MKLKGLYSKQEEENLPVNVEDVDTKENSAEAATVKLLQCRHLETMEYRVVLISEGVLCTFVYSWDYSRCPEWRGDFHSYGREAPLYSITRAT